MIASRSCLLRVAELGVRCARGGADRGLTRARAPCGALADFITARTNWPFGREPLDLSVGSFDPDSRMLLISARLVHPRELWPRSPLRRFLTRQSDQAR